MAKEQMEPEIFRVEDFEDKRVEFPDTLYSGGVGPCVVIGVYDPRDRSGHMIHSSAPRGGGFDQRFDDIIRSYGSLKRLKVVLTGGSIDYDMEEDEKEYVRTNKLHIEELISKYFDESQIEMRWTPGGYWTEFYLKTETGEFDITTANYDEERTT